MGSLGGVNLKAVKKKLRILEDDAGDTDAGNIGIAVEDSGDLFDLNIDGLKKARRTIMEWSFPEISQWLYEAGTQNTRGVRITHAGLNFTRCPR
jgi:hypothetical protein